MIHRWTVVDTLYSWVTLPGGLELGGCYAILGLSMDGHGYIVFLSYFAKGSWAWLLRHPWTIHGWSWIHCIPELLCQGVLTLAATSSLEYPWMVVDTLYSWVTLPRSLEPGGCYAILGLSMDGCGCIVFLSYFAKGSWAWLLRHPWTIHGWSWIHCIPELLCQGFLSLTAVPSLDYPWIGMNVIVSLTFNEHPKTVCGNLGHPKRDLHVFYPISMACLQSKIDTGEVASTFEKPNQRIYFLCTVTGAYICGELIFYGCPLTILY